MHVHIYMNMYVLLIYKQGLIQNIKIKCVVVHAWLDMSRHMLVRASERAFIC